MTYSIAAQVADDQLRQRCAALEAEIAVIKQRLEELERKPKRGRPRKHVEKQAA
jgi:hypothetical protein